MLSNRIVVTRNNDTSLLERTFPEAMKAIAAASSTGTLFGEETRVGEPQPEPFSYIPDPGTSTYRGSRTVSSPNGRPWNSPADVVRQEIFQHTDIYTTPQVHPSIVHQKVHIEDKIGDPHIPPPPTQINSIPPEFRDKVSEQELARISQEYEIGGNEEMNINDMRRSRNIGVSARPAPVITSSVPAPPPVRHYNQPPPSPPPVHDHSIEHAKVPYIPPTKQEPPFQPTEDMILKVNGYNERNMLLLGKVSKNITICTEMIAKLNDLTKPINVDEMMGLLEFMDNEAYRALFSQAFENLLYKNLELHKTLSLYLSGEGSVPEEEPTPDPVDAEDNTTTYPEGNVTVTSSDEDNNNTESSGDTQNDNSFQEESDKNS